MTVTDKAAEQAFELQQRIVATCRTVGQVWPHLAADLYAFDRDEGWKVLGMGSFDEWIADPDLGLPPRDKARQLVRLYKTLVVGHGVQPQELTDLDPTKLAVILPAVNRGEPVGELLADVRTLSRSDLREKHGTKREPSKPSQCPKCGEKF